MPTPISLVLSGGGARGIAHIGVIEELIDQDYEIKAIAGTSMGALVGGMYALGKLSELKDWMLTLDRSTVFGLVDFTFRGKGLVKADRVLNTMKEFILDADIGDLDIPFVAVAADVISGKEVLFRSGSIYEAIRASIAIPSVITPVEGEGKLLVDGGVLNNLPVNHVAKEEGQLVIAVDVNTPIPFDEDLIAETKTLEKESVYQRRLREFQDTLLELLPGSDDEEKKQRNSMSYFDFLNETIDLMMRRIKELTLQANQPDLLIEVPGEACAIFDFYKAEKMVEVGRIYARRALEAFDHNS